MKSIIAFLKTYFLFGFQILMAWGFTIPQLIRSSKSTEGMTITWSLFCLVFSLVNIFLAIGAYRQMRTQKASQLVIVYANWIVLWLAMLVVICLKGTWSTTDSILSVVVVSAVIYVLSTRRKETLTATLTEPITRGIISLIVKSTPQLYIAYCIIHAKSNTGLAGATLLIGHITVCTRIAEILVSALARKEDGSRNWSRHNVGLFISELGNELTWCVTTLVWFMY